jgi:hypothetical protein
MAAKWPHLWHLPVPNDPIQRVQRWATLEKIRAATAISGSGTHCETPAPNDGQNWHTRTAVARFKGHG